MSAPASKELDVLPMIGFIGIGVMGLPMALQLLKAGTSLVIWSRSTRNYEPLRALNAKVALNPTEVFATAPVVIMMLATETAMDAVLQRGTANFAAMLRGRSLVHMGTTSPAYSLALAADIAAVGGNYIECPVSGSLRQAQSGELLGLMAGEQNLLNQMRPLLAPMFSESFLCGPVPNALTMKLAVNLFLITTVTGLCEAFHFAQGQHLDLKQFQAILNAGPMASRVSTNKLRKLVDSDESVEASINDVLKNNQLIAQAARLAGLSSPLLDVCLRLFEETQNAGHGLGDMTAVLHAVKAWHST